MTAPIRVFKTGHHPDYFLWALVALLTVAGLLILASASSELGKLKFNDPYYYLKHQLTYGLSVGIVGFLIGLKLHYQLWRKWALILLLFNIALLVMVFTGFGREAGGASRWLQLGPMTFQPSELLKITFVIYLAAWFSNPKINRAKDFGSGLLPFFAICTIIGGLLIIQPATSTVAILLAAGAIVYFLSGVPLRYIFSVGFLAAAVFGLLIWSTPYRMQRVLDFLNPERDALGSGYQATQALIAVGSGGVFGMGYGKSTSKATTLPTPVDDSIFAVAAQELGFVGASSLVVLFGLLVFRLFWLARNVRDRFGHLILAGFGSVIALQSLTNMAAMSGLLPLTGVPLPFISYGGTALAVFLTMSGIALNISKYT
jgi:cell division protein FtsW